jgi:hypothetical protein
MFLVSPIDTDQRREIINTKYFLLLPPGFTVSMERVISLLAGLIEVGARHSLSMRLNEKLLLARRYFYKNKVS